MTLVEALGLERSHLVALCGAGGKTSLMFALAREWAAAGERILVTTTTKLAMAEVRAPWPGHRAADIEGVLALAGKTRNPLVAYRTIDTQRDKAIGFTPDEIDRLAAIGGFARILVEADGSARRPLKAPAGHEPAIPEKADAVIMVAGLSGLGQPLGEDTVFRAEFWRNLSGEALGQPVSARSLARMVTDPCGLARTAPAAAHRALFLNQADDDDRLAIGRDVLDCLAHTDGRLPERAVIARLQPTVMVLHATSPRGRVGGPAEGSGG